MRCNEIYWRAGQCAGGFNLDGPRVAADLLGRANTECYSMTTRPKKDMQKALKKSPLHGDGIGQTSQHFCSEAGCQTGRTYRVDLTTTGRAVLPSDERKMQSRGLENSAAPKDAASLAASSLLMRR